VIVWCWAKNRVVQFGDCDNGRNGADGRNDDADQGKDI
jgi:hypothetical protein